MYSFNREVHGLNICVRIVDLEDNLQPVLGAVVLSSDDIQKRIGELAAQISRDYAGKPLHLLVVLRGAVPFLVDLSRRLELDVSFDFISTIRLGEHQVKLIKDLDIPIEDKDVLLVEDIVNEGNTLSYLLKTLQLRRPRSLKICTLFDRPQKRVQPINLDYVGFTLDERFLVGFGLDYHQLYRNLPHLVELNFVK